MDSTQELKALPRDATTHHTGGDELHGWLAVIAVVALLVGALLFLVANAGSAPSHSGSASSPKEAAAEVTQYP